ncbi:sulfatase [Cyclobacterium xiamenense]|uniref:sulfatase family protein n=1 Tax=Cyclobacterium xiamenense TaxID=1297121 RepID=UPI0035D1219D
MRQFLTRTFFMTWIACLGIFIPGLAAAGATRPEKKDRPPNLVFLISEDNSKHFMKLFDPNGVSTPALEKMATEGLTYTHAFSNAPVCSVARSTLISGTLATRTGMHLHRKVQPVPMPEGLDMFPAYLRKAGYYTTNNSKKDYNAIEGEGVWDVSSNQASWQNRPEPDQPFFHQETFTESHESRLHFDKARMEAYRPADDPALVKLFPQYPDTPLFRYTTAYHRDKIREIDDWVARKIAELEEAGLLEDTFVFYFGDHGGVLPGSKGYLFETGLNVPLVVRIPENYRELVPYEPGASPEAFVSFVDFAPTLLRLAGIEIPEAMDGQPFLGKGLSRKKLESRDEAYGYADRFDEKYEMVRSLRKGKWKYIRSYQPWYPDALHNNYRYKMLAYAQWRSLHGQGGLDPMESAFFAAKPVERLYDVENDPFETKNLAEEPGMASRLHSMRKALSSWLTANNDLGFLPENWFLEEAVANPVAYGRSRHADLARAIAVSDWATRPWPAIRDELIRTVRKGTPLERYWAYTVAASFGKGIGSDYAEFPDWQEESEAMVQLRAIELAGILEVRNPFPALFSWIERVPDPVAALIGLNTLVYFLDHSGYQPETDPASLQVSALNPEVERRLAYLRGNW